MYLLSWRFDCAAPSVYTDVGACLEHLLEVVEETFLCCCTDCAQFRLRCDCCLCPAAVFSVQGMRLFEHRFFRAFTIALGQSLFGRLAQSMGTDISIPEVGSHPQDSSSVSELPLQNMLYLFSFLGGEFVARVPMGLIHSFLREQHTPTGRSREEGEWILNWCVFVRLGTLLGLETKGKPQEPHLANDKPTFLSDLWSGVTLAACVPANLPFLSP